LREELAEAGVGGWSSVSWPLLLRGRVGVVAVVGLYEGSWGVVDSVVMGLVVEDLVFVLVLVLAVVVLGATLDSHPGTLEAGFEDWPPDSPFL
jgi:hypothetical protein